MLMHLHIYRLHSEGWAPRRRVRVPRGGQTRAGAAGSGRGASGRHSRAATTSADTASRHSPLTPARLDSDRMLFPASGGRLLVDSIFTIANERD